MGKMSVKAEIHSFWSMQVSDPLRLLALYTPYRGFFYRVVLSSSTTSHPVFLRSPLVQYKIPLHHLSSSALLTLLTPHPSLQNCEQNTIMERVPGAGGDL